MDRTETRLREAERSGDGVALLKAKIRAGELTESDVEWAASLGHADARELCPDVERVDWGKHAGDHARATAMRQLTQVLDKTVAARVATDWATRVSPSWEERNPRDRAPQEAIAAARAWADCPCDEHGARAKQAHDAARIAAEQAYDAAEAAWEATADDAARFRAASGETANAAPFATHTAAFAEDPKAGAAHSAAEAAADAAYAAYASQLGESDRRTPQSAAWAALDAAWSSANAAAAQAVVMAASADTATRAAHAADAETEWQRLRLAAHVLGEVETSAPKTTD
jgi:hypothetical protein